MLQIFRRHAAFLLFVALAVFIGFTFWGDPNRSRGPGGSIKAGKGTYSQKQFADLRDGIEFGSRRIGMSNHIQQIATLDRRYEDVRDDYTHNVVALRQNREALGLEVSAEDVVSRISQMDQFRTMSGEDLNKWLSNQNRSLTEVEDLVRDEITMEKLGNLLSSAIRPSTTIADLQYNEIFETRTPKVFLVKAKSEADATATEEELKTYFDENQGAFQSGERRGMRYALFTAPTPPPAPVAPVLSDFDNVGDRDVAQKAHLDAQKAHQEAMEAHRAGPEKAYLEKVQLFSEKAGEEDADFATVAREMEVPLVTVPAFAANDAPDEIPFDVVSNLFQLLETSPISNPIRTPKGYFVVQRLEVVPAQPLKFEEARERISEIVIGQKTEDALEAAAGEAQGKLAAVLAEDGDLDAVAKELGLEPYQMQEFTLGGRLQNPMDTPLVRASAQLLSREVSEPVPFGSDRAIVCITRREMLPAATEGAPEKEFFAAQQESATRNLLLEAWIHPVKDAIVLPYAAQPVPTDPTTP